MTEPVTPFFNRNPPPNPNPHHVRSPAGGQVTTADPKFLGEATAASIGATLPNAFQTHKESTCLHLPWTISTNASTPSLPPQRHSCPRLNRPSPMRGNLVIISRTRNGTGYTDRRMTFVSSAPNCGREFQIARGGSPLFAIQLKRQTKWWIRPPILPPDERSALWKLDTMRISHWAMCPRCGRRTPPRFCAPVNRSGGASSVPR